MTVRAIHLVGPMVAALALAGCQGSAAFARTQEHLAQLGDKQDAILTELAALRKTVETQPAGAKAAPKKPRQQAGRANPKYTYKVPVGDAVTKGPDTALVTIVEWSDFQCGFCKRAVPTMKQIQDAYGDKVRVAFKHNPLSIHNRAMAGALAAEAAGRQGKFWEMHDLLFENARALTDENFEVWAGQLGLDVAKFKKDLADKALEKKVSDQAREGVKFGAPGTPAFFVNGRFVNGARPFDAFKVLIDEEIAKAEKLLASGVSRDNVYATLTKDGRTKV